MVLSLARLKKSCQELPSILKRYLPLFIGMHLVNISFNQVMIYLQELRMTSKDDVYIPIMLILALVGFITQAIIRTAWTFMVCHFFKSKVSLKEFLMRHLEQGLLESLRAFFRAVLWGFVFIFPGFHKFFQYQFVLYIVGFDENYDLGKVDVLEESVRLSKGHMMGMSTLLIIFGILSIISTTGYLILDKPLLVLFTEVVSFLLMLLQSIYFLHLFEDIRLQKATA